jgi:hypothetical protein
MIKRNEDAQQNLRDMGLSQEEIDQLLGIVKESYTQHPTAAQKMQLYDAAQAKINEEDKEKNRLLDEKIARDMRNNIGFTELKKQYMYSPELVAKRTAEEAANEKYRLEKMEIFNNRPENRSSLVLPTSSLPDDYHFRPISPRTNMASREGSPRPVGNVSPSEMIVEKGGKIRRTKRNRKSRKSKKSKKSKKYRKSKKSRKYRMH